jgi:hypothetical protein
MLATKIVFAKPSIGTLYQWDDHFKKINERKKNICKFSEQKSSLEIYNQSNFVPEHYKSFLNKSLQKNKSNSSSLK